VARFTFGSDPEFILKQGDKVVSAIGVIPGTKDNRHHINGNSYYYDNVLAECTIQPAGSEDEAVENVRTALRHFAELAKPYRLTAQASAEYPADQLQHEDAMKVGCDPEYCAYEVAMMRPPEAEILNRPLRSSGGHIHVGSQFAQEGFGVFHTIRIMDLFLGIPSVFLDKDETTLVRKRLYGQAGRFRQPAHGAEYRTLGNFWLASPKLTRMTYRLTAAAVDFLESGRHLLCWHIDENRIMEGTDDLAGCHTCTGYDVNALRKAIGQMDQKEAANFMPLLHEFLGDPLFSDLEELIMQAPPSDLYKEWEINV
jgi:hypothetical protein